MNFYSTWQWRRLAKQTKKRDDRRCQICGDHEGDPYCVLHAHHIVPHAQGGADALENLITLCDFCHAVVTRRWHKPWFGSAATEHRDQLEEARTGFLEFLALPPAIRAARQSELWVSFGIQ